MFVVCSLAFLMSGCWDRTEINDVAFVLATALDKEENGMIRDSMLIPLPGQMGGPSGGGGGTSGNKSYYIDSEVAPTFREARSKLQNRMSREIFMGHRRVIVVGERLARDGISEVLEFHNRERDSRMNAYIVVAKGDGNALLKARPTLERFSAESIRELLQKTGIMPVNIKRVTVTTGAPGSDPIIVYMGTKRLENENEQSDEIEVLGYAQFKKDRMVGVFQKETAAGIAWLNNHFTSHVVGIKLDSGQRVTVDIFLGRTRIKTEVRDGRAYFNVYVTARARALESMPSLDFRNFEIDRRLNAAIADYMRKALEATVSQMKKEGTDSAAFGMQLYRQHPALWKRTFEKDWPEHLKEAEFHFQVDVSVAETGLTLKNVTKGDGKR
jgi:spore germination protein KC/spore germination protein